MAAHIGNLKTGGWDLAISVSTDLNVLRGVGHVHVQVRETIAVTPANGRHSLAIKLHSYDTRPHMQTTSAGNRPLTLEKETVTLQKDIHEKITDKKSNNFYRPFFFILLLSHLKKKFKCFKTFKSNIK